MVKPVTFDAPSVVVNNVIDNQPAFNAPIVIDNNTIDDQQLNQMIEHLGEKESAIVSNFSQQLLTQVKVSDTDEMGAKLTQLVGQAKRLNPQELNSKGVMSKITSFFGSAKDKMMAQFDTVDKQMKTLVVELDEHCKLHSGRINDMEQMYTANAQSYQQLEAAKQRGTVIVEQLKQRLGNAPQATDPFVAQQVADLQRTIDRVERRVDDISRMMLISMQLAPQIRLMQDNAKSLNDKFLNIKTITIPAWTSAFTLYVLQQEQMRSVNVANAIDDATDQAFKMQADLLRQNTQQIAQAKERAVVSIETLQHVQDQLLGSIDDMNKIAEQARKARQDAQGQLKAMEQQLIAKFTPKQ